MARASKAALRRWVRGLALLNLAQLATMAVMVYLLRAESHTWGCIIGRWVVTWLQR